MNSNSGTNFEEVVRRERRGELVIGVDCAFARQFYTGVPIGVVKEHTGETPYVEKGLVWMALMGGPATLLLSAILALFVIGWWSALVIPVAVVVWIVHYGLSSRGGSRLTVVSILVVIAAIPCAMNLWPGRSIWALALLFAVALWLVRFVYVGSTLFLRSFVLRNQKAFQWLREALVLREVAAAGWGIGSGVNPPQSLRKISQRLGSRLNLKSTKGLLADADRHTKAEEALLDYCESQPAIQSVMSEFHISRHDLQELYSWLLSQGTGQWRSGHWVVASALAYSETLRYVIMRRGKNDLETAANLIEYFEHGSDLEMPRADP